MRLHRNLCVTERTPSALLEPRFDALRMESMLTWRHNNVCYSEAVAGAFDKLCHAVVDRLAGGKGHYIFRHFSASFYVVTVASRVA